MDPPDAGAALQAQRASSARDAASALWWWIADGFVIRVCMFGEG